MPALYKIIDAIESKVPSSLKEEWDNVGLILGDLNSEIKKAIIALDCTMDVINEATRKEANLIITHHPFIFDGVKSIDLSSPFGKKISKLIENKISVLSYHTNFDKAKSGTADTLANVLGLNNITNLTNDEYSLGRIGDIKECSLKDFVLFVKEKLNIPCVKYTGNDDKIIKKVAVVPGSGCEFYSISKSMGADLLVTAEVKHHMGIECMESDFAIVDAGHFETENIALCNLKSIIENLVETEISESYTMLFKYI